MDAAGPAARVHGLAAVAPAGDVLWRGGRGDRGAELRHGHHQGDEPEADGHPAELAVCADLDRTFNTILL